MACPVGAFLGDGEVGVVWFEGGKSGDCGDGGCKAAGIPTTGRPVTL